MVKSARLPHTLSGACLLLALFAQLILSAQHKSSTVDEMYHVFNGAVWFLSDEPKPLMGNPPLVNVLQVALPVATGDLRLPTESPLWETDRWLDLIYPFLWEVNGDHAHRIVFLTRLPVIGLTLLLAAGVACWARQLGGGVAGLLALVLISFDPNILAHGRLATTDLGAACAMLWAVYLFWRYRRRPSWRRLVLAGLGLGVALGTKFSALLLLPVFLLMGLAPAGPSEERRRGSAWRRMLCLTVISAIALLVFLSAFRFDWLNALVEYAQQQRHFELGHQAFLMGEHRITGWWYYFAVAFALKTPLPLLVLAAAGSVCLWRRRWDLAFLAAPPLILSVVSLLSTVNIGYRYLLPVLPFLAVLSSGVVTRARLTPERAPGRSLRRAWLPLSIALLVWYVLGTVRIYPHYLAYFNELGGGPENGWRYLVDSNLDWGQDLPGLQAHMQQRGVDEINLAWFGNAPPEQYGVSYELLPSWFSALRNAQSRAYYPHAPLPGVYAISATHLQGVYLPDRDAYAWFRERTPVAKIGYSIFVYDVPRTGGAPVSVALSGLSVDQIDEQTFRATLGTNDVTLRWFDARGALVLPGGGRKSWYALADTTPLHPYLRERFFADRPPWGRQQTAGGGRIYELYCLPAETARERFVPASGALPVWHSPALTFPPDYERYALRLPVDLRDLSFLGYELRADVLRPGDEVLLLTFWRVEGQLDPPLALFVHLLDAKGTVRAQHDAFSVDPAGLEPGDVLVQLHRFSIPPDLAPGEYPLEIGAYHTDTMQRWQIYDGERALSSRLLLRPVLIEAR
ncbi:MAG: glycosyltransferase family 39 protein [Anaerolineae bacterium]|nr:glycosyltransferase family 39 protein [Anaerolineae bacterium]